MKIKHKGRFAQIFIYFGKFIRMFIFQNDWKVLPMAAIIASLVAYVTGGSLFKTMEGTLTGSFALACICIWNGFFNSIQVICRERAIVKREHRAGLHITSYVVAHMLYQAILCLLQSYIVLIVYRVIGTSFPEKGALSSNFTMEFIITLFLITYASDMLALMVSSIAHSTTAAMTIMPFLLIVQLVFSGGIFHLSGSIAEFQNIMISKWGIQSLCIESNYNTLPMVSVWNSLFKMKNVEIVPGYTVYEAIKIIEDEGQRETILYETAAQNQVAAYDQTEDNILNCWIHLFGYALFYALVTIAFLEFIDKDKRQ